jgi:hypothetical protein
MSVRRLAASARLTFVADLLEELASQAGSQLADLAGRLTLLRLQRALAAADALLGLVLLGLALGGPY